MDKTSSGTATTSRAVAVRVARQRPGTAAAYELHGDRLAEHPARNTPLVDRKRRRIRCRYVRLPRLRREVVEAALYENRVPPDDEESIAYRDAEGHRVHLALALREEREHLEAMRSYQYELEVRAIVNGDLYAHHELVEFDAEIAEQEARVLDLERRLEQAEQAVDVAASWLDPLRHEIRPPLFHPREHRAESAGGAGTLVAQGHEGVRHRRSSHGPKPVKRRGSRRGPARGDPDDLGDKPPASRRLSIGGRP